MHLPTSAPVESSPGSCIFPTVSVADLRSDLMDQAFGSLNSATSSPARPFNSEEALKTVGLHGNDPTTGKSGVNLAGILLFGSDSLIASVLPEFKTQVLLRNDRGNTVKTREFSTNIPALMANLRAFAVENMPEHLILEEGGPTSLRDLAIHELFARFLGRRDYTSPYLARFVIENQHISLEYAPINGNNKENDGDKDGNPSTNSLISKFLHAMALTGKPTDTSGRFYFSRAYFGVTPLVFEGRVTKILALKPQTPAHPSKLAPLAMQAYSLQEPGYQARCQATEASTPEEISRRNSMQGGGFEQNTMQDGLDIIEGITLKNSNFSANSSNLNRAPISTSESPMQDKATSRRYTMQDEAIPKSKPMEKTVQASGKPMQVDRIAKIMEFCRIPRYREEIQQHVGMNNRDHFRKEILKPLIEQGFIRSTQPDKPNSPKQQYFTVQDSPS